MHTVAALHKAAASNVQGLLNYSGTRDRRMLLKWHNLTSSSSSMSHIPNLIWTDIMSNMVVGTKSVLSAFPDKHLMSVRIARRRITYNYVWAVPGLCCLLLWLLWALLLLGMTVSSPLFRSRLSLRALRILTNRLSVGRPLVELKSPENYDVNAPTKTWIEVAKYVEIDLLQENESNDNGGRRSNRRRRRRSSMRTNPTRTGTSVIDNGNK